MILLLAIIATLLLTVILLLLRYEQNKQRNELEIIKTFLYNMFGEDL